jgi:hypothetical protein
MIWLKRAAAAILIGFLIFCSFCFVLHGIEWSISEGERFQGIRTGFLIMVFLFGGLAAVCIQSPEEKNSRDYSDYGEMP